MPTNDEHHARPTTAAPPSVDDAALNVRLSPQLNPNAAPAEQHDGEGDDGDAGMFSFMPPPIHDSLSHPSSPLSSGATAQYAPDSAVDSGPYPYRHVALEVDSVSALEAGAESSSLSAPPDGPPSSVLSPAAAYALAAQHGALDADHGSSTRYRGGWRDAETPDGRIVDNPYDGSRGIQFGESRRTSEGSNAASNNLDPYAGGRIPPDGDYASSPFAYGSESTAIRLQDFSQRPIAASTSDDDKSPLHDARDPMYVPTEDDYDDEDSPYPEVRASVSNLDDPTIPCFTFRTIILGLFFTIVVSAANAFLYFRYPAPLINPIVVQLVTYPCGKFLAWVLPTTEWDLPKFMTRAGFGERVSLNPGYFNIKEHTVLIIIANVATGPAYALNFMVAAEKFYDVRFSFGFDLLFILTTQMAGFGVAGLCRRFLVWPASMIWPQNLVYCTLLNTLHAEDEGEPGGTLSRFRFLTYVFAGAFCWYFLPGFLFQALSAFSFICWAAPNNVVVNQLFGINSGLGMSGLTFDWSQISFIGSPLIVPWWAIVNVFGMFLAAFYILVPILYYTNVWDSAYLPISTATVFDRFGMPYNTSRVLDKANLALNVAAYESYSPLYLPITYAIFYGLGLMLSTSLIVHTALYHGPEILKRLRAVERKDDDIHMKLMRVYREVPDWWYLLFAAIALGLSICTVAAYNTEMPVWGVVVALVLATIYTLPAGFIFALSNILMSINLVTQICGGYLFPGKPLANMLFKSYAGQSLNVTFSFVSDLKLGHYQKIPPRITFFAQLSSTFVACFVQVGVKRWLVATVPDFCSATQSAHLICPQARVFYSSSVVWGLIGPQRILGVGAYYSKLLWWLLAGAVAPAVAWGFAKRYPRSFAKSIHFPVALAGSQLIPPASGINYTSWFLVGFAFQFLMRRRRFLWWSKYNFVLSAGLDSGTVISSIVIFLALSLPKGGSLFVNWWGNTVFTNTLDFAGATYKIAPEDGFGRTSWT